MNEKEFLIWLKGYFDGLGDYRALNTLKYCEILNIIKEKIPSINQKQLLTENVLKVNTTGRSNYEPTFITQDDPNIPYTLTDNSNY